MTPDLINKRCSSYRTKSLVKDDYFDSRSRLSTGDIRMRRFWLRMWKNKVLLLMMMIMLTTVVSGCGNSSAKQVVEKYFKAVKAGNLDKAIECFTPDVQEVTKTFTDGMFGEDGGAMLNELIGSIYPQEYADYEFKPVSETKTDDTHTVVTVEVNAGGSTVKTEVHCIRIDGKWYIEY